MSSSSSLNPRSVWQPIEASQWTDDNIRHLLRRASWAALPNEVERLREMTPGDAVDYLFQRADFPQQHPVIEDYADAVDEGIEGEIEGAIAWAKKGSRYEDRVSEIKEKNYRDPHLRDIVIAYYNHRRNEARRSGNTTEFNRQFRDRFGQNEAWKEYAREWLKIASRPQNSAFEKATTFLQNVWVVNWDSLRGSSNDAMVDIHNHHQVIRENLFTNYPDFCKKAFKTRGMGRMLDIIGSTKARPNENFARELMELFTLGVDNGYDEDDIKEIAKAFTGYKPDPAVSPYTLEAGVEELILDEGQHDDSRKKVFGRNRDFDGDDIVDVIFTKDEVEEFLPSQLVKFYLTDDGLPEEYTQALGGEWAREDFNLYWLFKTFFTSRAFYSDTFKGRVFKSPHQFYFGLLQDLSLSVEPGVEIVGELGYLGQPFADPPDVNGWNGGAFWMNNGTINARRLMAQRVFSERGRGGDPKMAAAGGGRYSVSDEQLAGFLESSGKSGAEVVDHFITYLLAVTPQPAYTEALHAHFASADGRDQEVRKLKQVILAILQSQYYQVC